MQSACKPPFAAARNRRLAPPCTMPANSAARREDVRVQKLSPLSPGADLKKLRDGLSTAFETDRNVVREIVSAFLRLLVRSVRVPLNFVWAVTDEGQVPLVVAASVPVTDDMNGQEVADLVLRHAGGKFATAAHHLELVSRARIPFQLDVQNDGPLLVDADYFTPNQLADGFELFFLRLASADGRTEQGEKPKVT